MRVQHRDTSNSMSIRAYLMAGSICYLEHNKIGPVELMFWHAQQNIHVLYHFVVLSFLWNCCNNRREID